MFMAIFIIVLFLGILDASQRAKEERRKEKELAQEKAAKARVSMGRPAEPPHFMGAVWWAELRQDVARYWRERIW